MKLSKKDKENFATIARLETQMENLKEKLPVQYGDQVHFPKYLDNNDHTLYGTVSGINYNKREVWIAYGSGCTAVRKISKITKVAEQK